MSQSSKVTKGTPVSNREASLSIGRVILPDYESGGLSTGQLAQHLTHMLETHGSMDGEAFTRANGTARVVTKFWDTLRGLERNTIEREKLTLKMGSRALPA